MRKWKLIRCKEYLQILQKFGSKVNILIKELSYKRTAKLLTRGIVSALTFDYYNLRCSFFHAMKQSLQAVFS